MELSRIVCTKRRSGSVSRTPEGATSSGVMPDRSPAAPRRPRTGKTLGHMGKLRVGELVGRVLGAVVMGIAVKGRVRDHQGTVTVAPERAVIAPGDARDEPEGRDVLQREARMGAKEPGHAEHHLAGPKIGHEAEEIAAVGAEETEERRIAPFGRAYAAP